MRYVAICFFKVRKVLYSIWIYEFLYTLACAVFRLRLQVTLIDLTQLKCIVFTVYFSRSTFPQLISSIVGGLPSCPVWGFLAVAVVLSGFIILTRYPCFVNHILITIFRYFFHLFLCWRGFVFPAASACCRSPRDSFYTITPSSLFFNPAWIALTFVRVIYTCFSFLCSVLSVYLTGCSSLIIKNRLLLIEAVFHVSTAYCNTSEIYGRKSSITSYPSGFTVKSCDSPVI